MWYRCTGRILAGYGVHLDVVVAIVAVQNLAVVVVVVQNLASAAVVYDHTPSGTSDKEVVGHRQIRSVNKYYPIRPTDIVFKHRPTDIVYKHRLTDIVHKHRLTDIVYKHLLTRPVSGHWSHRLHRVTICLARPIGILSASEKKRGSRAWEIYYQREIIHLINIVKLKWNTVWQQTFFFLSIIRVNCAKADTHAHWAWMSRSLFFPTQRERIKVDALFFGFRLSVQGSIYCLTTTQSFND